MLDRFPKFYDEESDKFNISEELKIAYLLGEDIDNPKITFKQINSLLDDRIQTLSKKLYEFIKDYDMDKQSLENITDTIKREIENIENDNYYEIKKYFSNLLESIEEQKSYNLLLQKQITSLKKEKVDIMTQITQLNSKLDDVEKDLGINLNMKRGKKK